VRLYSRSTVCSSTTGILSWRPLRKLSTSWTKVNGSMGLAMKPTQPAASAMSLSPFIVLAVRATTGTSSSPFIDLILVVTS